jgi:hypothetical protein
MGSKGVPLAMTSHAPTPDASGPPTSRGPVVVTVDLAIGASGRAWRLAEGGARRIRPVVRPVVRPVTRLALRPPGVPRGLQPASWLTTLAEEGAARRATVARQADTLVPEALTRLIQRAHLDEVIPRSVDLAALAAGVIDEVDLPEVIRESTGSMASVTVREARLQAMAADESVGRVVDRLLLRRRPRTVDGPRA